MSIAAYIREIGRGHAGARALNREQACDLMAQVLDGRVSDLEIGAFCLAMRIKGETAEEMAGFLDAIHPRLQALPAHGSLPLIVLPSYNGARRLPVLTPLLALLLAREGLPVLLHGSATEDRRADSRGVLQALGHGVKQDLTPIAGGTLAYTPMAWLCPGLHRLLEVRRVVGLRNSAHSLVKLLNPSRGPAVVVGSYTHPEYALSMAATLQLTGAHAMLLRGTEGEPVADARRTPQMDGFVAGHATRLQEAQDGPLAVLPQWPAPDAESTARYIREVLEGVRPVPPPIALQVQHLVRLAQQVQALPPQPMQTPAQTPMQTPSGGAP